MKRASYGRRSRSSPTRASTASASATTSGRWRTRAPAGRAARSMSTSHGSRRIGAFPTGATGEWTDVKRAEFSQDAFVEGAEAGRFLEIWNLVFMQYDRQPDGVLKPLPKPSVDTGAGLERIAAVMQRETNNYHTDLFVPLIDEVVEARWASSTGAARPTRRSRRARPSRAAPRKRRTILDPASYRVIADHARAVAFLIGDGVFPANDGRGYVLRRILRRAVRHAFLLGRTEPTLVHVVAKVIETMGGAFPELQQRAKLITRHHARRRGAIPRDDRRRHAQVRAARAGAEHAGLARDPRHDLRAKMRSSSTTPTASRSISPSSWRASAATRWTSPASSARSRRSAIRAARSARRARSESRRTRSRRAGSPAGSARRARSTSYSPRSSATATRIGDHGRGGAPPRMAGASR